LRIVMNRSILEHAKLLDAGKEWLVRGAVPGGEHLDAIVAKPRQVESEPDRVALELDDGLSVLYSRTAISWN
jgi:hypothetical protein